MLEKALNTKLASVKRALVRTFGALALLWILACGALFEVMRQPPETFARFMTRVPAPIAFVVLPFETLWTQARAGSLQVGDLAPDFSLMKTKGLRYGSRLLRRKGGRWFSYSEATPDLPSGGRFPPSTTSTSNTEIRSRFWSSTLRKRIPVMCGRCRAISRTRSYLPAPKVKRSGPSSQALACASWESKFPRSSMNLATPRSRHTQHGRIAFI